MWARAADHARKKVWFSICAERRGKGQISALQKMSPPGAFNTAPEAQFVVGLPIPPSRLRRATVPQFNMVASLRAQSALAMFPVSLGLLRPVSATGGGLRAPLFPSGKRRLLAGQLLTIVPLTKMLPLIRRGRTKRAPCGRNRPKPSKPRRGGGARTARSAPQPRNTGPAKRRPVRRQANGPKADAFGPLHAFSLSARGWWLRCPYRRSADDSHRTQPRWCCRSGQWSAGQRGR